MAISIARRVTGGLVPALIFAAGTMLIASCSGDDDSEGTAAEQPIPDVVTETIAGIPDDIPAAAVPAGADASGIVASAGEQGSSAAEFTLAGNVDRDAVAAEARAEIELDGWTFFERVYDETTMQMSFTRDDATLTWTLVLNDSGAAVSVVVVGG
jgi:hypothetical protein